MKFIQPKVILYLIYKKKYGPYYCGMWKCDLVNFSRVATVIKIIPPRGDKEPVYTLRTNNTWWHIVWMNTYSMNQTWNIFPVFF